jgi:RNA-directed DNA polymerase
MTVFSDVADKIQLARMLAVGTHEIDHLLSRLSHYYRPRKFPKSSGGFRTLLVPQGKLKTFQQKIKKHILDRVPVLACIHGGVKRRSIITNAEPHVSQAVVFSLDIENFFPHVDPDRVSRIFRGLGFGEEAVGILVKATTWKYQLPQGAATSTGLSNLSMIPADSRILRLAEDHGFNYTRFVDDITLSGEWRLLKFRKLIPRIFESEGFRIRPEKTMTMDRGMRQVVTKLVVNGKINVSREQRRAIRREALDFVDGMGVDRSSATVKGRVYWLQHVNPNVGARLVSRLILRSASKCESSGRG